MQRSLSANNQNNIANGTTANAGQGAVMLYNKTNLTSPQTTYTLDYNTYLYRDKFGLVQNFGTRVTMDSNASRGANADLVAIAMSDQADPTYQVGDNILDRNTGNLTYWSVDTKALNSNGTLKTTNITYSVGQNIYNSSGEKTFYSSNTRAFNTDGSYKMQTTGTYALGDVIKNSDGTNAVYTSVDDLRKFNANGSWDGVSYHSIGDVKRIELDRAQVLANPTNPGYTVLMNADSNYNSALINNSTNPDHLNGIKAAGDNIRTHVMNAAGSERKIELANTASTTSVGFVQTGFRAGMSGIRQEYNLAGSVRKVELGDYTSLVSGSPGKIAADLAVTDPNFLPNRGDRKMAQEHGGAVYLFKQDGTLLREFKPNTLRDGDNFGSEIVIEGNKIFIGAAGDDAGGSNAGAVYVFDINTGNQLAKINGSTANARVGSVNSITGDNGLVAIGRLTGSGGKDKVDFYNTNSLSVVRSMEGSTVGDKFGYSMEMKGDQILISSFAANSNDGTLALYNTNTGNIVQENGLDLVIQYSNPAVNPQIGFHGVDFNEDYLVAKGSNNLIYTFNRNDMALKTVNTTSVSDQEFMIEGNNLYVGEYDGANRVAAYDVTAVPTTENLNMSLTLHDVAFGLSATLPEAISSISVSSEVTSFSGGMGDNLASGFDLLSIDTALKNFANMKQSYENQISRIKKRSEDILERRDKIASVQAFDEDNVSKILNTVYGSQPFDLSSIMQPFDKGIVSSLLP